MFELLESGGRRMELAINESNAECMSMTTLESTRFINDLTGNYTFKGVKSFTHLCIFLNDQNKIVSDLNKRIIIGNRAYFENLKLIN